MSKDLKSINSPILVFDDFFDESTCNKIVNSFSIERFKRSKFLEKGRKNKDYRIPSSIHEELIISKLKMYTDTDNAILAPVCIYMKYDVGDYVKRHTDSTTEISPTVNSNKTLIVYLNDDYVGGETYFESLKLDIKPKTGKAILFDQGNHLFHEGKPVTKNFKYIFHISLFLETKY